MVLTCETAVADSTFLSQFVGNLNSNIFFREFSFSRTSFKPQGGTEIELADHVVRIGPLLFLYQLKERDRSATISLEAWLQSRVLKKATRQIRNTVNLVRRSTPVFVANGRGHVFDVAARPDDSVFRLILFKSGEERTALPYPRFHLSRSVGFIHILDALDYFGVCTYFITPIEIADYLTWRERALQSSPDAQLVPEAALVGQYLVDELNSTPSARYEKALGALQQEISSFDLSMIFHGLGDRVEYALGGDRETSYYPILALMARLTRLDLRHLKERLVLAFQAVEKDQFKLPWRIVCPALDCGFLVLPITKEQFEKRLVILRNVSLAAKYEQHTPNQIGISVARFGSGHMIDWFYASSPWVLDEALEALLRDNYPFRPLKEKSEPRYRFSAEHLRRSGLRRNDPE